MGCPYLVPRFQFAIRIEQGHQRHSHDFSYVSGYKQRGFFQFVIATQCFDYVRTDRSVGSDHQIISFGRCIAVRHGEVLSGCRLAPYDLRMVKIWVARAQTCSHVGEVQHILYVVKLVQGS